LVEQAFGPVTVVASRPTPPDQRPCAAAVASSNSNGHRPDPAQGHGAERDGQTSLDLTATVSTATVSTATVSTAAPSVVTCNAGEEVRR